ncbi:hypothetical protein ACLMJK_008790 [Lecanora helva]
MARSMALLASLVAALQAYTASAQAVPAAKQSYCANFDNLPQNPTGFDPTIDPVGTYKGITYQGFVIATQQNSPQKPFQIPSQPNIINTGTASRSSYGGTAALLLNTTTTGFTKDSFTLSSLRLACVETNGAQIANANGCTALFVGNKRSGAASVTFEYEYPNQDPGEAVATFGTVVFPKGFKGLSEVFVTLTQVQGDVVGTNILVDDVCLSIQG